jgi:hypothetical protein
VKQSRFAGRIVHENAGFQQADVQNEGNLRRVAAASVAPLLSLSKDCRWFAHSPSANLSALPLPPVCSLQPARPDDMMLRCTRF